MNTDSETGTRGWMVVVGIDQYQADPAIKRLHNAVDDTLAVAELLRTRYGYQPLCEPLLDSAADLDGLTRLLDRLRQEHHPDDNLFFYFAGHGTADDDPANPDPIGYLVPHDAVDVEDPQDARLLPMTAVRKCLEHLDFKKVLAVLDCCHAGGIGLDTTRDVRRPPGVQFKEVYEEYHGQKTRQAISSATFSQAAKDSTQFGDLGRRGEGDHSPFAAALLDVLQADDDEAWQWGVMTTVELTYHVTQRMRQENQRQIPGLWTLDGNQVDYLFEPLGLAPHLLAEPDHNPYRGLLPYEVQDCDLFYGRDREHAVLRDRLLANRFVTLVGRAGVGKSSLMRAGLIADLLGPAGRGALLQKEDRPVRRAAYPPADGATWAALLLRPQAAPLDELAEALGKLLGRAVSTDELTYPDADADAPAKWVGDFTAAHPDCRLLLAVDQLEELILECSNEDKRVEFLNHLGRALNTQPGVVHVALACRADYQKPLKELVDKTSLAFFWDQGAPVELREMDPHGLREVIEQPVRQRHLRYEAQETRRLEDQVLEDVQGEPGALPLLSFTLGQVYETWARDWRRASVAKRNRILSFTSYEALGGATGALGRRADEVHEALVKEDASYERTVPNVMLRMVQITGEGGVRPVPEDELDYPDAAETKRAWTFVAAMEAANLLVVSGNEPDRKVEPAHSALMQRWAKLVAWRDEKEAQSYLPLQRELAEAAHKVAGERILWDRHPKLAILENILLEPSVGRPELPVVLRDLQRLAPPRQDTWLSEKEVQFVVDSVRTRARTLRLVASGITAVIVILGILLAVTFVSQRKESLARADAVAAAYNAAAAGLSAEISGANAEYAAAEEARQRSIAVAARETAIANERLAQRQAAIARARELAVASQAALDSDPDLALLLAVEAMTVTLPYTSTADAAFAVTSAPFVTDTSPSAAVTQSLHVAAADQALLDALAQPAGRPLPWLGGYPTFLSTDGRFLFDTKLADKEVWQWDMEKPADAAQRLPTVSGRFGFLVYGPEGMLLLDSTGPPVNMYAAKSRLAVCLASDRTRMQQIVNDLDRRGRVSAISSDAQWLVLNEYNTIMQTVTARLVNLCDTSEPGLDLATVSSRYAPSFSAEFSNDGLWMTLVTTNDTFDWRKASAMSLWKADNSSELKFSSVLTITGIGADSIVGTFSPDGRWLAYIAGDPYTLGGRTLNYLSLQTRSLISKTLTSNADPSYWTPKFAFTGDSRWLVGWQNLSIRLWDTDRWQSTELLSIDDPNLRIGDVEVSPDGHWLLAWRSSYPTGVAWLWDLQAPNRQPRQFAQYIESAVFSLDGRWLVTRGSGDRLRLWDMSHLVPWPKVLAGHTGEITAADFSPDGKWLATGSTDGTVRLWNREFAGFPHLTLTGFKDRIGGVSFSADGTWLAVGSSRDVGVWRMDSIGPEAPPTRRLKNTDSLITSVAFSRLGSVLAVGTDRATWVYDLEDPPLVDDPVFQLDHDVDWPLVSFSADDRWLASVPAKTDDKGYLWSIMDRREPQKGPDLRVGGSAAFGPDGHWLVGPWGDAINLWDIRHLSKDPTVIPVATRFGNAITSVAFSRDPRWLALETAEGNSGQGQLGVLDMHNPREVPRNLSAPVAIDTDLSALTFSRQGQWLAAGGTGYGVLLWNLDWRALIAEACTLAGRNLTLTEWQTRFPDQPRYRRTCPNWPGHISAAEHWWYRGTALAREGQIAEAVPAFEEALAINPDIARRGFYVNSDVTDETYLGHTALEIAGIVRAKVLSADGFELATQDEPDLERAIELFSKAKELNPEIKFIGSVAVPHHDPERYARFLVAMKLLEQAGHHAADGDGQAALAKLKKAFDTYDTQADILVDDNRWSRICWHFARLELANQVINYCEHAVIEPDSNLWGGRGLARAVTGDYDGAAADFSHWLNRSPTKFDEEEVAMIENAISTLRLGRSPFDAVTLDDFNERFSDRF